MEFGDLLGVQSVRQLALHVTSEMTEEGLLRGLESVVDDSARAPESAGRRGHKADVAASGSRASHEREQVFQQQGVGQVVRGELYFVAVL